MKTTATFCLVSLLWGCSALQALAGGVSDVELFTFRHSKKQRIQTGGGSKYQNR